MNTKTCTCCKQEKPVDAFGVYAHKASGKTYRHPRCKTCRSNQRRERYVQNHDKELEWSKKHKRDFEEKNGIPYSRYFHKFVETMTDGYIRRLVAASGVKKEDITQEMIEARRQQIRAKRELKARAQPSTC